jgi:alpha-glucosidase
MYDFAEYIPQDAVFFNGMDGMQAHNLYPVLYQRAAFDLLERVRPGNYLIFVRSGYAGTGGLVPDVWGGDNSTDFDLAKGLPAALLAGLNGGMSGIPIWGSDISGFHYLYNPPPDKEVYLRWTEVGAFSADMHDENAGVGSVPSSERWQIWNDQESQDVYRTYASYKTRMIPYVRVAVREARERGIPIMRHLYLHYPEDPNVITIEDEYMYGDSLLVAPVVARGETSRSVYLPEPLYYDFWKGERVQGSGSIVASAALDAVPVYAKVGAIVPLLAPDVETVVPSADGSVVSAADRANYLEVAVFAGGQTSLTLDDGTVLTQSAPVAAFAPTAPTDGAGPIAAASTALDLMTCNACYFDDPATHVWSVAVVTADETITSGPLTVAVHGSSAVKRFVFTVRH